VAGPEQARTRPAVDVLKVTQKEAATVRCGCRLACSRWGLHWRHQANTTEPCSGDAASCHINLTTCYLLHRVSKKVPPLACYNFDTHEWILIFFWQKCYDKVGNQKTLYYATSNNLCFGTTWQNAETRTSHISLNWIVLHTQCTCALSSCKKKITVICDVFDSV